MTVEILTRAASETAAGLRYAAEGRADAVEVEALVDAAFGPGRFAKTAERLREGNALRRDLCVCAWSRATLVGAVRLWPVRIGAADAVFLGPIAVEAGWRKHGIGAELVERACAAAAKAGDAGVLLVGDPPFFGPLGFERAPASVVLPGPVDAGRVLWRPLRAGIEAPSGRVSVPPLSPGARAT